MQHVLQLTRLRAAREPHAVPKIRTEHLTLSPPKAYQYHLHLPSGSQPLWAVYDPLVRFLAFLGSNQSWQSCKAQHQTCRPCHVHTLPSHVASVRNDGGGRVGGESGEQTLGSLVGWLHTGKNVPLNIEGPLLGSAEGFSG